MIELDDFKPTDFQQLIEWIDSEDFLVQWGGLGFSYPLDNEQLKTYIENTNHKSARDFIFAVRLKETGDTVGHISLRHIDQENKSARIAKVLVGNQHSRGQGIGQQMIHDVLRIAFDHFQLHRVSLGVFDFNTPAIACYEKAGFTKEGLLRDCRKRGSDYWSLWEMSILENEWRDNKSHLYEDYL
ncbi:GNAT family protein [Barrientosiimonas marina]|uniref:GNAT family N-acetyltransferase n=1 Tax=Lentibacillus kimchii TaxID=1542911 RepID=A0ABW2UTN2_9BACI